MFDVITRSFVLLGYLAVAVNTLLILRKASYSRYRVWSLAVMGTATAFWSIFYIWVQLPHSQELAADWSRIGHTLTIGAFMIQQFMITQATRE